MPSKGYIYVKLCNPGLVMRAREKNMIRAIIVVFYNGEKLNF